MKQNPEAREKFKEKERENYKKKKECGKIKLVANLTPREQRQKRKEWRTRQNKCRQKKKQLNEDILSNANSSLNTPSNTNQTADGRRLSGRKRVRKERSAVYRALIKSQEEVAKYKKMSAKLKKRLQRNKDKQFETPNRKVNRILRSASKKEIRKKLLFGEVLELELKEKAKEICIESEKRKFTNIVSGKIIKKYKLLQKTKFFLSNRQRLNIGCQPVKRRKKANLIVTLQLKDKVVKFFEDDASSALTPGKKEFVTKNKIRKQKRILLYSLKKLHQKFNQSFGNIISYPTFCKLKPFWVVHPKVNQRDTCLCIKHANFQYLIDKLHFLKLLPQKSSHDASAAVCCDTLSQACMYRQCSRCKHKTLAITVSQDKKTEETFYYQWLPKTEERKNKDKIIRVKFTVKNKIVSTVEELINVAKTQLNAFLKHSYNYHHQLSSMKSLRTSLNPNEVIVVIDFSENYLCKYASEVQSAHFGASKQQVSLHTGVIYKQNMSLQDEITSFCTISDILRHDASAVWAHIVPIINLIRVKYTDVETIHFQSDGPTNQYRNRTNFYFLTLFAQKFNLKSVTWNFTESGHGKGPADGIGGTVKRTADEIVAFGSDINNAKILFQCLSAANLKVQFFEISEADINAIDHLKPKDTAIPSIPNLMKLHQLTWNKFENVKLQLRYLSCFTCDTHEKCRHYSSEPSFVDLSPCFKNMPNECKGTEVSTPDLEREHIRVGAWVAVVYDENWFPALTSLKKPRHKGFLNTLLCCFGAKSKRPNPPIHAEDSKDAKAKNGTKGFLYQGKYLLPQIRHQDAHKMCLVIDLDETLVHSSFKPISNADFIVPVEIDGVIHQVYVLKRPYVDEFLQKMGEMYECVLFTASLAKYADPVADLLDKWGVFRSRLFRESCVFYRGNYVKDLGRLGRELHKVIIVDNSPASYIFHPDNAVPVNSWFDDMSDTELRDLIPFFEQLSKMDDVYSVLRNSNHAAGSHPQPNTLNGSHFISPQIQHVNGFMQPS